ncbi:MAG: TlpA family protein disulfide reductase [Actinomycetales bacterium]|nr:TlpA family protein disulfide reductase [Actinomycetales bacterium]
MTRTRRSVRRAAVAALAVTLAAGTAACSPSDTSPSDPSPSATAEGFAFTSPDGTVRAWDVAERGEPLELSGTDYDGAAVDVAAHRGELVLLNTWYAFCPPCRAEAADLVAIDADYPELHLFGINGTDDAGTAQAFERQFEVTYPSIDDADGAALAALQGTVPVSATPTTIVLDREGRVAIRVIGMIDATVLRPLVDALLVEAT